MTTTEVKPTARLVPAALQRQLEEYARAARPFKRGGSHFICQLGRTVTTTVPKLDKNGRKTRYTTTVTETKPCKRRVKIGHARIMIRHMKRVHGL